MRRLLIAMGLLMPCFAMIHAEDQVNVEQAAVEKCIASYVAAFNSGDAKALSAHWTEQGEYLTPAGEKWQGQKQLSESFTAYFAQTKNAKLEIVNTKVEQQSPSVIVETGTARVLAPDQEPLETDYQATHVKTTAGWKIDSLKETAMPLAPPSNFEQLQELAWMVGQWGDAEENSRIETACRWTRNQIFLVQSFKVYVEDRVDFEGTQIIGWDPQSQSIRSWTFDSDGGFGVGRWSSGEGRWSVQTLNVLPDGRRGSATNVYELVDKNTVRYRSVGRQVDGELLPSVGPVTVIRTNPE